MSYHSNKPNNESPENKPEENTDRWAIKGKKDGSVEVRGNRLLMNCLSGLVGMLSIIIVGNPLTYMQAQKQPQTLLGANSVTIEQFTRLEDKIDKLTDTVDELKLEFSFIKGRMSNVKGTQ